jgi:hypothetical protein
LIAINFATVLPGQNAVDGIVPEGLAVWQTAIFTLFLSIFYVSNNGDEAPCNKG